MCPCACAASGAVRRSPAAAAVASAAAACDVAITPVAVGPSAGAAVAVAASGFWLPPAFFCFFFLCMTAGAAVGAAVPGSALRFGAGASACGVTPYSCRSTDTRYSLQAKHHDASTSDTYLRQYAATLVQHACILMLFLFRMHIHTYRMHNVQHVYVGHLEECS